MDNKLVTILAVLILAIGFYATGQRTYTGGVVGTSNVEVQNLKCMPKTDGYEICGEVKWDSPTASYAKAVVVGVESLNGVEGEYKTSFEHCVRAGRTGAYAFNVYLYNSKDKLMYKKFDNRVSCEAGPSSDFEQREYVYFIASGDAPEFAGKGEVYVDMMKEPESCEFIGEYELQGSKRGSLKDDDATGYYCAGGKGVFKGYADAFKQNGIEDADYFSWFGYEGQGKFNPPEQSYDGFILKMRTCDTRYLEERNFANHKNYVNVRVSEFGKRIKLDWEYRDVETRPQVLVKMNVLCKMKQPKQVAITPTFRETEDVEETIEMNLEDAEPLEPEEDFEIVVEEEPMQMTWIQRVKKSIIDFFSR